MIRNGVPEPPDGEPGVSGAAPAPSEPPGPSPELTAPTAPRTPSAELGLGVGAAVAIVGVGVGARVAAGVGVGAGVGFGVGFGVGRGVGRGVGLGVGLGVGFGVGLGVGFGVGVGAVTLIGVGVPASDRFVQFPTCPALKTYEYVPAGRFLEYVNGKPAFMAVLPIGGTPPGAVMVNGPITASVTVFVIVTLTQGAGRAGGGTY
jgi:hypothetical protein